VKKAENINQKQQNVFWQFLIFGKIQDGAQGGGHLG